LKKAREFRKRGEQRGWRRTGNFWKNEDLAGRLRQQKMETAAQKAGHGERGREGWEMVGQSGREGILKRSHNVGVVGKRWKLRERVDVEFRLRGMGSARAADRSQAEGAAL
jgi:hypothetical protein